MSNRFRGVEIRNYRSLEQINIQTKPINVLFGPNGAGKSTFLDAIWFVRDCAIRGVDIAASNRSHGIGVLWDGAGEGAHISIKIETESATYEVMFGFSSGRIEPFVAEKLYSKQRDKLLIDRLVGSDKAGFFHSKIGDYLTATLREPNKLALSLYLDLENNADEAAEVDRLLRYIRSYHSRSADFYRLRTHGSISDSYVRLYDRCENLWSVLRILKDEREIGDDRYDTIIRYMQKSFPSFDGIYLEQTGANSIYGNFVMSNRREPIKASGVSDGYLQLLAHLTALFCEGRRETLLIFDEPEESLHPYAIAIFAEAVEEAARDWQKQVFMATHSPVLISQFDADHIIATETGEKGETIMRWVSEIEGIQDLLAEYAAGSLYMAELVAAQSRLDGEL